MMPGRALHRLAARVCSRKTLERIVEPAIADLQKEYGERMSGRRRAWRLIAGYATIFEVIAICALSASDDDERQVMVLIVAWSFALVVAFTALLMLPPLYAFSEDIRGWYVATTLVPQALPLAIPIGTAFGLALGFRGRADINSSKVLLVGAVAASAVSFAALAWGMPVGNQAFRELTFRQLRDRGYEGDVIVQKGYNEMTFSELRREIASASAAGEPGRARQAGFSFHLRFSLAAATLVMACVILAMTARHRALRTVIALVLCLAYWVLLVAGDLASRHGYLPVAVGAWLPNAVLASAALVIASSRSSRLRDLAESAR